MRLAINPLRDMIAVKQDDEDWEGDIYLPVSGGIVASQEQRGRKGTVHAIGEGIDEQQLKLGDRVIYGEFEYPTYFENGVKYLILRDKDICGVIE